MRQGGLRAHVIDAYGDADTRALAADWARLPAYGDGGLDAGRLADLARRLLPPPAPLLWASCLEDRGELLAELQAGRSWSGTPAATVTALKDPTTLAALLAQHSLRHPAIAMAPQRSAGWLVKQAGAAGGRHVQRAGRYWGAARGRYWQREVSGQPASLQLLAAGPATQILGYALGCTDPEPAAPFRFGGVALCGPAEPPPPPALVAGSLAFCSATGLRGLASLDLLLDEAGEVTVLEVNPRPGAALDALLHRFGGQLMAAHADACAGRQPPPPVPRRHHAMASRLLWAPRAMAVPAAWRWPAWATDRPAPGAALPAGQPICTVHAHGPDARSAQLLAKHRADTLLSRLAAAGSSPAIRLQRPLR